MPAKRHEKINGDPAALMFDRAVGELRRGRAVQVVDGSRGMIVAAVEALQTALFARLVAAGAGRAVLLLTAERAHAARLSRQLGGPVAITFRDAVGLEQLRSAAGVGDSQPIDPGELDVDASPGCASLATAGFQLAKAGRLVPALIGFETKEPPGADVIAIDTRDIERHERVGHHSLELVSRA